MKMKYILSMFLLFALSITDALADVRTVDTKHGSFLVIDQGTSTVLAAPHGTYDINTGNITESVCYKLKSSCVIANGFTPKGSRINVNRPTEGVGKKSSEEINSNRAEKSYKKYVESILSVAEPDLELYIEVHGSGIKGIEVATHNIPASKVKRLKYILAEEWQNFSGYAVSIRVQGLDKIKMTGNAVKSFGIVSEYQPMFIQFELARKLRNNKEIMASFLSSSIRRFISEL